MAIKFADKKPEPAAGKAKASVEARFATPIETDDPVNPDAGSELPFGKVSAAERKARKKK